MSQKKIFYFKRRFPKLSLPIILFIFVLLFIFFAFFGIIALAFFSVLTIGSVLLKLLNPFKSKKVKNYDPLTDTYTLEESDYEILDNEKN